MLCNCLTFIAYLQADSVVTAGGRPASIGGRPLCKFQPPKLWTNKLDRIPSVYHDFIRPMLKRIFVFCAALSALFGFSGCATTSESAAGEKRILLVAGNPSHGPGDHEFNAGSMLLAKCLNQQPGIKATVAKGGWPADEKAFDGADAILFYMDGGA